MVPEFRIPAEGVYELPAGVTSKTHPLPHAAEVGSTGREAGEVATISRYDVAPVIGVQLKFGGTATLVAPLLGD